MLVLDLLEVNDIIPSYFLHSIEFGAKIAIILHTLLQVPKVILELLECHLMGMFGISMAM